MATERAVREPYFAEQCPLEVLDYLYAKAVEASPDAIIVVNLDRVIVIVNQQTEFLFGYDRSEMVGKEIDMLIPPEVREKHSGYMNGFFSDPRIREMAEGIQLYGIKRSGDRFRVQIKLAPLIVRGGGLHVMAVVRRAVNDILLARGVIDDAVARRRRRNGEPPEAPAPPTEETPPTETPPTEETSV